MKIKEYRKLLNDNVSSDEQIQRRLDYLEALCRNVIRTELEKYYKKVKDSIL
jgi:DNA mismatch repair ATPase MutS